MMQPTNIQFTQLIKAGGRLREFNFRKSQGVQISRFTVDVANEKGDRQYLFFRLNKGQWILENKITVEWIAEVLPQLEEMIRTYR